MIQFDYNIFQMGWNQQPVIFVVVWPAISTVAGTFGHCQRLWCRVHHGLFLVQVGAPILRQAVDVRFLSSCWVAKGPFFQVDVLPLLQFACQGWSAFLNFYTWNFRLLPKSVLYFQISFPDYRHLQMNHLSFVRHIQCNESTCPWSGKSSAEIIAAFIECSMYLSIRNTMMVTLW